RGLDGHRRPADRHRVPPVQGVAGGGGNLMFSGLRDRAVDLGYAAGWSVVKSAPHGLTERAFRAAADAAAVRNGGGARQLRKNLSRVVGPQTSEVRLDALVGAGLRSYSRYWLETFRLPK